MEKVMTAESIRWDDVKLGMPPNCTIEAASRSSCFPMSKRPALGAMRTRNEVSYVDVNSRDSIRSVSCGGKSPRPRSVGSSLQPMKDETTRKRMGERNVTLIESKWFNK